jgi:Ni/Fe-hydrogenase subunit HybB-like protein
MLTILFIYFVGKKFYTLAETKHKNKWLFTIIGLASYYAGLAIGGFILGALLEIFASGGVNSFSDFALSLMAIPFGLIACFGLYWIFKNAWQGDELKVNDQDFPTQEMES